MESRRLTRDGLTLQLGPVGTETVVQSVDGIGMVGSSAPGTGFLWLKLSPGRRQAVWRERRGGGSHDLRAVLGGLGLSRLTTNLTPICPCSSLYGLVYLVPHRR